MRRNSDGREAEDLGHAFEEGQLARMQHAIGLGDFEQPVEHVFEDRRIVAEQPRDLLGIGFEAGRVLARQIEDAPDIGLLATAARGRCA